MDITMSEWLQLVDNRIMGITPGFGYAVYKNIICPHCEAKLTLTAKVYSVGFYCYVCSYRDRVLMFGPFDGIGKLDGPCLAPVGANKAKIITSS